jgi:hypothetical protein
MSKLATLNQTLFNAARVLGKPGSRRWQVFEAVDGKSSTPQIAKKLGIKPTNCANDMTELWNKGLIEPLGKTGKAVIHQKVSELRNTNLKPYARKGKTNSQGTEARPPEYSPPTTVITQSRAIETILGIGEKYGIANIDQDWTDSLVILNFAETILTKFLMDHGYTVTQIETLHWDDKVNKVQNKLYEEANKKGIRPRKIVLSNLGSYRTTRNMLDHEAHLPDASIKSHEVGLLLKLVQTLAREIFDEHKSYCALP